MTKKRIAVVGGALVLATLVLVALALGFVEGMMAVTGWLGLHHQLGIDTQSSQNYDFVSGVGPMFVAALGFTGAMATVLHHLNCHEPGCPMPGRFPVAGGQFRTCRRHHPDEAVRRGLTSRHIAAAHEAHKP